jgi:hypothetical protein
VDDVDTCGGHKVEQVEHFNYFDSMLQDNGQCIKTIKKRIAREREAFINKTELTTGMMSKNLSEMLVKSLMRSAVLYGAETYSVEGRRGRVQALVCTIYILMKI